MKTIRPFAAVLFALSYAGCAHAQVLPGQQVPDGVTFATPPASSAFSNSRGNTVSPFAALNASPVAAQTLQYGNVPTTSPVSNAPLAAPTTVPADGMLPPPATSSGHGTGDAGAKVDGQTTATKTEAAPKAPAPAPVPAADLLPVGTRLAGWGRVLSGDTLILEGHSVTLFGVAAPRPGQTCYQGPTSWKCGDRAKQALDGLVARGPVVCVILADSVSGSIGRCSLGHDDLGRAMAETGLVRSSEASLRGAVDDARADGRGLWVGPVYRGR